MMMLDTCSVNRAMNCIIYPWSPTFLAPETYFVEDTFFFSLWIAGWGDDSHTLHLLHMSFII